MHGRKDIQGLLILIINIIPLQFSLITEKNINIRNIIRFSICLKYVHFSQYSNHIENISEQFKVLIYQDLALQHINSGVNSEQSIERKKLWAVSFCYLT